MDLESPRRQLPECLSSNPDLRSHFNEDDSEEELCRKQSLCQEPQEMNTTGNSCSQLVEDSNPHLVSTILMTTAPRDSVFKHGHTFNDQHKRVKTARRVSSFVFSTIVSIGIFSDVWSLLSFIQVQPLHKEHLPVSIWPPLLELLGFMVFVWAVAIMILVGAPFTRMQTAMLISWGILMHLKSADSITAVFVPLLGILLIGRYVRAWKKQPPNEGK